MLLWAAFRGSGTGVWRRAQQAVSAHAQQPPAACPLPYPRMSFEQVRGGERPYLFGAQPANCTSCRRGFNVTSLTADDHDYCEFWSQVWQPCRRRAFRLFPSPRALSTKA